MVYAMLIWPPSWHAHMRLMSIGCCKVYGKCKAAQC